MFIRKSYKVFWPAKIYKKDGVFFLPRPWFFNEFSKLVNIKLFCNIVPHNGKENTYMEQLDSRIEVIDFFKETSFLHFISNYFLYKKKINKFINNKDYFFIFYPFRKTSVLLAYLLRKTKLVVWVKSDYVDQLTVHGNNIRRIFMSLIKPFVAFIYNNFSKFIFKNNLIFYTGNITIDRKNHINQYEIISSPLFIKSKDLIKNEITHQICFVGNESNQKGLSVLLKALTKSELKDKLTLNIIGLDKIERKKNINLIKGLKVNFHGKLYKREEFYKTLAQNDILIMSSFAEKQGKVQLEAMSVGVVPICSDSGGTYMTVKNFYNGLLFRSGNHKDLRKNIELLYSSREFYENLKENGLEFIKGLSLEKQVKQMITIINNFYEGK